ncbi:MAG: DUF4139 domain-containing protein [Calditrichaeota bacterium]|nr:DUF4139 domain-containing protein [Calditrichota bacterium]
MKLKYSLFLIIFLIVGILRADEPKVAVTIYNNNLALVREIRTIQLKKGLQEFRFVNVAAKIDPTSVRFKSLSDPADVDLLEQNFEYDLVGTERLLQKYIDQQIVASTKEGHVFKGKLLNTTSGDVILQSEDGSVVVVKAAVLENIQFPALPEGLLTRPTLVWLLNSKKGGRQESEISYLTRGIKWHAEYIALTNKTDTKIELSGWVSIENKSGATYKNAKVKLVAGDVHEAKKERRLYNTLRKAETLSAMAAPPFQEKAFFEYHLYTLQRPSTIRDRQTKQLSLFEPTQVKVEKIYTFDGLANDKKVSVDLEFKNDKAAGLGIPLPKGKFRVYKQDEDQSQEFIGEDNIDHTPKDEKVKITLGNAFDLVGERTILSDKKMGKRSRKQKIQVILRNHKNKQVVIHVLEHFWGDWEFVGPTPPIIKKDAEKVEFKAPVPANGEKKLEFTVLTRW